MSESLIEQSSASLDPFDRGTHRPPPWLAVGGLLSLPLLVFGSLPLLRLHVERESARDFSNIQALGVFALATEVVVVGTLAALVGLLLRSRSRRRRERWRFLRIASWTLNGIAAAAGIIWIALLLIGNAMIGSSGSL